MRTCFFERFLIASHHFGNDGEVIGVKLFHLLRDHLWNVLLGFAVRMENGGHGHCAFSVLDPARGVHGMSSANVGARPNLTMHDARLVRGKPIRVGK